MNFDKANAALDSVYTAETPEALARAYAEWAATYDSKTASLGYLLPFLVTAWVVRHVPAGEGPLLDAGCGTGLSGPSLKALGYGDIAGLDLSDDMLRIAGSRQAYNELKKAMLGGPLPWPDGQFSQYSDGEKGLAAAWAQCLRCCRLAKSSMRAPLPSLYGERCRQAGEGQRERPQVNAA